MVLTFNTSQNVVPRGHLTLFQPRASLGRQLVLTNIVFVVNREEMNAMTKTRLYIVVLAAARLVVALPQGNDAQLKACGDAYYYPSKVRPVDIDIDHEGLLIVDKYTCYDGDFLCPILSGEPTLRCGPACYLPSMYSCSDDHLVYPPASSASPSSSTSSSAATGPTCSETPLHQHLSSPPYENYFFSDCHSANQVVVTSPQADSNLTIIGPRLLVCSSPS